MDVHSRRRCPRVHVSKNHVSQKERVLRRIYQNTLHGLYKITVHMGKSTSAGSYTSFRKPVLLIRARHVVFLFMPDSPLYFIAPEKEGFKSSFFVILIPIFKRLDHTRIDDVQIVLISEEVQDSLFRICLEFSGREAALGF